MNGIMRDRRGVGADIRILDDVVGRRRKGRMACPLEFASRRRPDSHVTGEFR